MDGQAHVVQNMLMKKSGRALSFLAGEFLMAPTGARIATFAELAQRTDFSRGTLQNAMNGLSALRAIALEKHGTKGTFLIAKNTDLLLQCRGISCISGIMALPYTKVYEGLATGLFNTIGRAGSAAINLAYMRGSEKRIAEVLAGRYDFAVTSRLAAAAAVKQGAAVVIAADFGPGSYLSGHSVVFRDAAETTIRDGMRVGVDQTSLDHTMLTKLVVGHAGVVLSPVNYNQVLALIQRAEIDAAVWNNDHIVESGAQVNCRPIRHDGEDDETTAVLVMRDEDSPMRAVLGEFLDISCVLGQQREVVQGLRYPNY